MPWGTLAGSLPLDSTPGTVSHRPLGNEQIARPDRIRGVVYHWTRYLHWESGMVPLAGDEAQSEATGGK